MKALNQINLISKKPDERAEAAGLVKAIQNFDFVFLIVMQEKLLTSVAVVSQFLQRRDSSLFEATTLLEAALLGVKKFRNDYEDAKKSAELLANSWGTEAVLGEMLIRRKKALR